MPTEETERTWYYVTQRGAGTSPVFATVERRDTFVFALSEALLEIHGYAVLPWRYHLLLRSTPPLLVPGLRRLVGGFTELVRATEGTRRPLLSARCDRIEIAEPEVSPLLSEIHFSPVAARLVNEWEQYDWSSYRCYVGAAEQPPWLMLGRLQRRSQEPPPPRSTIPPSVSSIPPPHATSPDDRETPALGLELEIDDRALIPS